MNSFSSFNIPQLPCILASFLSLLVSSTEPPECSSWSTWSSCPQSCGPAVTTRYKWCQDGQASGASPGTLASGPRRSYKPCPSVANCEIRPSKLYILEGLGQEDGSECHSWTKEGRGWSRIPPCTSSKILPPCMKGSNDHPSFFSSLELHPAPESLGAVRRGLPEQHG